MQNNRHSRLLKLSLWIAWICLLSQPLSLTAHERCNLCHLNSAPTEHESDLVGSLPTLCIECHQERTGNSEHAINVMSPDMTESLPLLNGRLGCTTCHDPHGTSPMQLRIPAERLCMNCHHF